MKTNIPREVHAALFSVINKARLLNGWMMRTAQELDPTIRVWFEALSEYQIPASAYDGLYKRALDVRQMKMQIGAKDVPYIDAALLISQWTGPNGFKAELRQREVDAGRTLTTTARSNCLRCYGTDMEAVFDEDGNKIGTRPGCKHEYVDESDPHSTGINEAMAAVKIEYKDETAVDICSRIRQQLAHLVVTSIGDENQAAWTALKTWTHAEKYCRENPIQEAE